ncbi:MAG: hypothetical protein R6U20_01105, partial [Longimonas sp.]
MSALSLLILLIGMHMAPPAVQAQDIYHVTETGDPNGSGASFADSDAISLQGAIDNAGGDDVIVIAAGRYVPSQQTDLADARTATFLIDRSQDGLKVYGGWDGTTSFSSITEVENELQNRDLAANRTVLSGDIDGDDITSTDGITETAEDIEGDNSYTVVYLAGSAGRITLDTVLDGLVITGGNADGTERS